jgi:hypothetical protein
MVYWSSVSGATGHMVYMGSKKVKTTNAKTFKYTCSKKKAAKYKFKVIPYCESTSNKGTSEIKKPVKNQCTFNVSTNYASKSYATAEYVIKKVALSGKTYTITGYCLNNRIFKMAKYKKLVVMISINGKTIAKKTYKNLKVNAKPKSTKKIVLKIKGKAGKDLAYGGASYHVTFSPKWTY